MEKSHSHRRWTVLVLLLLLVGVGTCSYRNRTYLAGLSWKKGGPQMAGVGLDGRSNWKTTPAVATIEEPISVLQATKKMRRGKSVRVAAYQSPGQTQVITGSMPATRGPTTAIGLGAHAGTNYLFPHIRFQQVLSSSWIAGIHLTYAENIFSKEQAQVYGGGATVSYFFKESAPFGPFVDGTIALYNISGTNSFRRSEALPMTAGTTLGWALSVFKSFDLTASAGVQYAHNWNRNIQDIDFKGWMPLFKLSVGYDF